MKKLLIAHTLIMLSSFSIVSISCAQTISESAPKASNVVMQPEHSTESYLSEIKNAGRLMEIGITAAGLNDHETALIAFRLALDTNQLNNAGKVVAYWNLFMAAFFLERNNMDDLQSFIVIGEDIIGDVKYASGPDGKSFSDRFELKDKLLYAHNKINEVWEARKNSK